MSLSTFSVRDIVATPDDADVLQTSLEELYRRRRAKRQEERARKRWEQSQLLDEDAGSWGTAQELAYRREVLHTWTRQYPRLREAMVSLAAASSSNTAATAPAVTTAAAFSVAETVRPSYPTLWRIPAGTIPADFYTHNTAMEVSQLLSTPQRQHATTDAVKDYSAHSCLVRVRWEPVRVTDLFIEPPQSAAASFVRFSQHPCGSTSHAQLQPQRVLARWPQGKPASAKMAAVLRSIGIEERKREQWNEHLRRRQQQQQQKQDEREAPQQRLRDGVRGRHSAASVKLFDNLPSSAGGAEPATEAGAVDESYSAVTAASAGVVVEDGGSGGGSAAYASESALGHELYWPAHITRTRALFTGAACLQDTFHGLGQLQRYERFEPVLALALASPLRIVVDVVYTVDETSEAFGLSIDPVVHFHTMTSSDACRNVATRRDSDAVRSISLGSGCGSSASRHGIAADRRATLSPSEISSSMAEDECPVLLPSSLPPVLSDLNYAFTAAPTAASAAAGGGGSADSRRAASQTTSFTDDSTTTSTAALRRSTLSTSPLSLYTILAGPASQTHSIVLLRPTPEVVCAARARALQELEQRWLRLRQALADRLVACEEQAPTAVLARSPMLSPADVLAVELPDANTYASPFIDRSARQGEGLPAEPAGAESLTEEEMQRQTRLPQLQGGHLPRRPLTYQVSGPHGVNGRLLRLSSASLQTPPADPGLRTRSLPSSARRPSRGSGAQDDGASAEAAALWPVSTPPTSSRPPQQSPCTSQQSHARRADRGAWSTDEAASASAGGDDGCGALFRGSERISTAAARRGDAGIPRTPQLARSPVDPNSLCSPASCEGLDVPCTDGSSSDLDGLRSALLSEGRRAATEKSRTILAAVRTSNEWPRVEESMARAPQQPATMPRAHLSALTLEASLPVSPDAWRLANGTDHVGSAAAPGSPRKASPSSTSLPSRRHRHNDGSPMDTDTVMQLAHDDGDSSRHRTCSAAERYSAILSVSAQSVPDSQPMSALREVSVTSCLSWDVRNTMNDTASQHSSTGDGDGRVAPYSGGSGAALPTSPSPQLCTPTPTYLPLPSRLNKNGAPKIPDLSTPDIAVTLVTPYSTVSSPTSPPPHAASPMLRTKFFTLAAAPPHADDHSQSPSSVRYPILQQPPAPLCHADAASARSSTKNTAAQLSATRPPVAPAEPPLQCSRAASSSSSSDATRSVLTHTSRPGEKILGGCTKNEKTLSAVPARGDPRTEARSAPQATRSTALESSSSSDDAPVLSGTATYSSYIQVDPLSSVAVAQGMSAVRRAGAAALSTPQTPHVAARELRGASASTPSTRPFSSPTFLSDKRRLQLHNLEQSQREPMRRVSPPPPSSLSTSAEARARVHPESSSLRQNDDVAALSMDLHHTRGAAPGTAPCMKAAVVEVGPQQRPRLCEGGSAGATRHSSARHREHASPLQSGTDAVEATTASANHRVGHGGSSDTSGAVESDGSPLPRRPPSLASSPATGANDGAHEAASRPMSANSAASKPTAPCAVTSQPPSQHTDGAGATGLVSGEPRPSHCPQASASSRMHHRRPSPRAPETAAAPATDDNAEDLPQRHLQRQQRHERAGSVSVAVLCSELSVSVDREVELPEQPVRLPEVPTPRSPQRSQPQQQPYLVTVNAAAAKSVRSGEPATGLHSLDKFMHSGREGLLEAHQRATRATQSRKASADVRSWYRQAHPHHRSPGEAAQEDSASTLSSAPSASSSPLPLSKSRRPAQRPSRHVGSAGSEKSDAVGPRALSTSCMHHTTPPAAAASASSAPSVNFSSLMSSAAPSPRGTSPAPHPSGRSSRSSRGGAGELLVLRPHRSTSSSQHNRRYHDRAVALSPSPLSTTRRHRVLVRRVVRRRRSEVFVEEGGTLVYRAPMATPHLLSSSSGGSGRGASAPTLPSSPRDTRAARARKTPRRHSHT
ncbi:conserved hypothetical protein [Leishmania infantum JPCM5]|uniref:Uncharacterized protein n=2 Tax=Leishmania infantum TaxID=5671 RepID=A4HSK9_LEIIN|nr:conserved hypothetical protein [Leishmania infantum JPCM5]CAC9443978.1 hypothetical_protein_-_conserved [Leishmania infantum]CAM65397.1 conserved hypothetical protein [Leishmania infantum JPCM5]SUZ39008.1 hypothetical_protein_-_conserved [Leishmania infantum]|eukprot:XP_001463050.1 conserved hypothetical protein [Leishmania infantum JPCM5]